MKNSEKAYVSTRNKNDRVTASEGIVKGLSADGGLYVPDFIDDIHFNLNELSALSYAELAKTILGAFLTDFTPEQTAACIDGAYNTGRFDAAEPVQLTHAGNSTFLELWHGPTAAFKDMALTVLPYLMTVSAKNTGLDKEIVILTATSGDTGKAALEGFRDVPGTRILVFYPQDGVSPVQELQMLTQEGANTDVIGVSGNFDDTQNGVKAIFSDEDFRKKLENAGMVFSSANSINIGRLLPQIVYYYYSYFQLVKEGTIKLGEPVNFAVPTGNFGNILAGVYAKMTGLPVETFICASNDNNVLTEFFQTGVYDKNREFYKTISPSMDILISSNLERLLYERSGRNADKTSDYMKNLGTAGSYTVNPEAFADFYAGFADEAKTMQTINDVWNETGVLIDPHTAVAEAVRRDYAKETGDNTPVIVLSTASPFKFAASVLEALGQKPAPDTNAAALPELLSAKTGKPIPAPLQGLGERAIRHTGTCDKTDMAAKTAAVLELSERSC